MHVEQSDLVGRLHARLSSLTAGQRKVAEFLLQTHPQVALLPAVTVAERAGISEATVIRLATALGYRGYAELQRDARRDLGRSVHRLRSATEPLLAESSLLTAVAAQEIANIRAMADSVPPDDFDRGLDLLCAARQIYVSGARSSWHLAEYLGHVLTNMLGNATVLPPALPQVVGALAGLGAADLLIIFSFPRYTATTVEMARYAKARGAAVICFADSTACPVAADADVLLCTPIDSIHGSDSYTSTQVLLNTLMAGLSRKTPDRILASLRRLEETYTHFDIFYEGSMLRRNRSDAY